MRGEGDEALRRVADEAVSCLVTVVTYNISSWGSIVGLTLLLFPSVSVADILARSWRSWRR